MAAARSASAEKEATATRGRPSPKASGALGSEPGLGIRLPVRRVCNEVAVGLAPSRDSPSGDAFRCKALRFGVQLIPSSTHAHRLHLEERRDLFNLFGEVAYPNRAVMRRTVPIPGIHEISDIE